MVEAEAKQVPEEEKQEEKARRCLDNMLAHFREFGSIWDVTAGNIKDELHHFNAWGTYEEGTSWQDVTLLALRAAYRQRIQELEGVDYMTVTTPYREDRFFGTIIDQAIAGAEELEKLINLEGEGVEVEAAPKWGM